MRLLALLFLAGCSLAIDTSGYAAKEKETIIIIQGPDGGPSTPNQQDAGVVTPTGDAGTGTGRWCDDKNEGFLCEDFDGDVGAWNRFGQVSTDSGAFRSAPNALLAIAPQITDTAHFKRVIPRKSVVRVAADIKIDKPQTGGYALFAQLTFSPPGYTQVTVGIAASAGHKVSLNTYWKTVGASQGTDHDDVLEISFNDWHRAEAELDFTAHATRLFVDGVLSATYSFPASIPASATDLLLGIPYCAGPNDWRVRIDNVLVTTSAE